MKLVPSRIALGLLAAWLALGIAAAFVETLFDAWRIAGMLLGGLLVADAVAAWQWLKPPEVRREVAHNLAVGRWSPVGLRLSNATRTIRGELQDAYPPAFEASALPQPFSLGPGEWRTIEYRVRPLARGSHPFGRVWLRAESPMRLWLRRLDAGTPQSVRVYPDFAKVAQYALLATDNRLSQIGVLQRRRRGEGVEFHQLREYRRGDTSRQIDWKATARVHKLISREYQDERDQRIVFLLDCGQRMRAHEGSGTREARGLSHFDHTLNALLLLSYVALRQGDAVGVLTFAHPRPRYFAPRKSVSTVNLILNGLYDLEPTSATPDYLSAGEQLLARLSKRSLVVLLTNLRDEDDAILLPALNLLQRRHLTLLANLRETSLDGIVREPVKTFDEALTFGAAAEYLRARSTTMLRLRQMGVRILDAYPQQLPRLLVNKYWDMKRAGQI
jgi:uncharacterized protein (DUF58 family)